MRAVALLLAGVLVAPASFAQHLGDQTGIMGGESGFFDPGVRVPLSIEAQPFARTVTCTGARTLTGTATGAGAVTWAASPDGASGACTGTTSWSCPVAVSPNAAGEGVETITVSQAGGGSATVDVGFYVAGAHSCFLAQSYDGAYNAGKLNLDAVGTWVNLGSSSLNVTQATGSAQPTYRTAIVGGQPVVRCDGGDRVAGAAAVDWTFLYQGAAFTAETVGKTVSGNGTYAATGASNGVHGYSSIDVGGSYFLQIINETPATNLSFSRSGYTSGLFHLASSVLLDDGGAGTDASIFVDSLATATGTRALLYSTTTASPLTLCAYNAGGFPLTGDLFRVLIYSGTALDATQRGINKQTDEWALGGTLPVTP